MGIYKPGRPKNTTQLQGKGKNRQLSQANTELGTRMEISFTLGKHVTWNAG